MATGQHFRNPIIEVDRTNVRQFNYFVPVIMAGTSVGGNVFAANGVATMTRIGGRQYAVRRTAAATNHNPWIEMAITPAPVNDTVPDATRAGVPEVTRGLQITSVNVIYVVDTEAIDAIAATFGLVTFTGGNAPSIYTSQAVTVSGFSLGFASTIIIGTCTFTTPVVPTSLQQLVMDLRVDDTTGGGGTVDIYGVRVNGNFLL